MHPRKEIKYFQVSQVISSSTTLARSGIKAHTQPYAVYLGRINISHASNGKKILPGFIVHKCYICFLELLYSFVHSFIVVLVQVKGLGTRERRPKPKRNWGFRVCCEPGVKQRVG